MVYGKIHNKCHQKLINQNTTNTHPQWAFWKEQEGLFFTSNRKGGGEVWIFGSHLKKVLHEPWWHDQYNGDEVTPFIIRLNKSYTFSSDFHPELVVRYFSNNLGQ